MKRKKRLLSFLLVFSMMLSFLPSAISAEPEPETPELIQVNRDWLGEKGLTEGRYDQMNAFDEQDLLSYPPDAVGGYKPPVDSEYPVTQNLNIWRTGGNPPDWEGPHSLDIQMAQKYHITEIYVYDAPAYCVTTPWAFYEAGNPLADVGDKFEVEGGYLHLYIGDTLIDTIAAQNNGEWVKFTLPDVGLVTDNVRFVKEAGDGEYYWCGESGGTTYGPYTKDVSIGEIAMYGTPQLRDPEMIQVDRAWLGEKGQTEGRHDQMNAFDELDLISYPPDAVDGYKPPVETEYPVTENLNIWRTGGGATDWEGPHSLDIQMNREFQILEVYVYDAPAYCVTTPWYFADSGNPLELVGDKYEVEGGYLHLYIGDTLIDTIEAQNNGEWVQFTLPADGLTTDNIRFVKETGGGEYYWCGDVGQWLSGPYIKDVSVGEIVMYGIPLGEDPKPEDPNPEDEIPDPQPAPDFDFTFGEYVGTNAFAFDNLSDYEPVGFIREYHNWVWTEASAGEGFAQTASTANPEVMFTNRWGSFDAYYENLKNLGIGVSICIQGGVYNTNGLSGSRPNYQGDMDSENPHSYLAHAQSMFQHAARYGYNTDLDPALVKVAPGTEKKIGMGLVTYYENWNEPNATWEQPGNQFTAKQFAAMSSADFDGHMGTMGPGAGVKNADPNAKFVMGGMVGMPQKFLKEMYDWFKENRSEEKWLETHSDLTGYQMIPFDVLNVHYYCPDGTASTGLSPEADNLMDRVSEIMDFRSRYYPEVEIWMSEFGWDSTQGSPQSATVEYERNHPITGQPQTMNVGINPGLDGKEVQGRWLVREYLILAAAGFDRVQQFMMPDSGSGGSGRFETCGFLDMNKNNERKPSWYYVGTMKYWLETTQYEKEINTGLDDMLAYQFKEKDNNDRAIALWLTTSLNRPSEDYSLTLPEGTNHAYLVTMVDKLKWGEVEELVITDGQVTVGVSEKPVFVLARANELNYDGGESEKPEDYNDNSKPEGNYLLDLEFNDQPVGEFTADTAAGMGLSFWGGSVNIARDQAPIHGNTLEFFGASGSQEIQLDINGLQDLIVPGKDYMLDFKLKFADDFTAPGLMMTDKASIWTRLMDQLDTFKAHTFNSRWWGEYTVPSGVWNRFQISFNYTQGGGYKYKIILNGEELVSNVVNPGDAADLLAFNAIRLMFFSGSADKQSHFYVDDIYVYEIVPPKTWLDLRFDDHADGQYVPDKNVNTDVPSGYVVVTPEEGSPLYTDGGKVLQINKTPGVDTGYFTINGKEDIVNRMMPGESFIIDFEAFVDQEATNPFFEFVNNNWGTYAPFGMNWWGQIYLPYTENGEQKAYPGDYAVVPNIWHRFVLKMVVTEEGFAYETYIDDMETPIVVSEPVAIALPLLYLRMQFFIRNDGANGYIDNLRMYSGTEIRPAVYTPEVPQDIPLESYSLNKSALSLELYKTATLSAGSFMPVDTTSALETSWQSSDPDVVRMTGNGGQIKAVAPGIATITCTIDGIEVSCVVVVYAQNNPVTSFNLSKETLTLDRYKTATFTPLNVLPQDATNLENVKWFTSNPDVVAFTGNGGQIKGVGKGTANITCQIGSVKVYCKVTVK